LVGRRHLHVDRFVPLEKVECAPSGVALCLYRVRLALGGDVERLVVGLLDDTNGVQAPNCLDLGFREIAIGIKGPLDELVEAGEGRDGLEARGNPALSAADTAAEDLAVSTIWLGGRVRQSTVGS
jgi:hypothetical protein